MVSGPDHPTSRPRQGGQIEPWTGVLGGRRRGFRGTMTQKNVACDPVSGGPETEGTPKKPPYDPYKGD